MNFPAAVDLSKHVPEAIRRTHLGQRDIPRIARDPAILAALEEAARAVPTHHLLLGGDARDLSRVPDESIHLVLTSPPYWTLKEYRKSEGQLGHVRDYEDFLNQLDAVWRHCLRVLVPGGRLIIVVGDVCLSRRRNHGRHTVVPLHASIQERTRSMGFDNLSPIIWYKIANAIYEVSGGGGFLGKPFEPNAVIKNDIEFILMERKSGGYRTPTTDARLLSVISAENHQRWFQQIWTDVTGASTREHPAPYPITLAERLVRMFSFVGDTVLDPFLGTGTTSVAALQWGRNSIGVEIDEHYLGMAKARITRDAASFSRQASVSIATVRGEENGASRAVGGSSQALLDGPTKPGRNPRTKRGEGS